MPPYRTHSTELTDDELMLMDAIAFDIVPPKMLTRRVFRSKWGHDYTHSLDAKSLKRTLGDLCRRGLSRIDRTFGDVRITATTLGGEIWAKERTPVWDLYIRVMLLSRPSKRMVVWSPGNAIPDAYLDLSAQYDFTLANRTVVQAESDWGLLPWRRFEKLYSASGDAIYNEADGISFEEYEAQRSHWMNLGELQKFIS